MEPHNDLTLILVRHTQTDDNVGKVYSGQRDVPLNAMGQEQAAKLAHVLAEKRICAIYVSDLCRTMSVARIVARHHEGVLLQPDRRLRELDLGKLAGMTKEYVKAHYADACFNTSGEYDFSSVGGEMRREVIRRQLRLLREVREKQGSSSGVIVFIGHGTALQSLLDALGSGLKLHSQGEYTELVLNDMSIPDESSY